MSHNSCFTVRQANTLQSSPGEFFREKVNDVVWSPKDATVLLCCCTDSRGLLKLFDVVARTCLKTVTIGADVSCYG